MVYFSISFGRAPVQEKRRITEGDEEQRDEDVNDDEDEGESSGFAWSHVGFRCQMPSDMKSKPVRKFGRLFIRASVLGSPFSRSWFDRTKSGSDFFVPTSSK